MQHEHSVTRNQHDITFREFRERLGLRILTLWASLSPLLNPGVLRQHCESKFVSFVVHLRDKNRYEYTESEVFLISLVYHAQTSRSITLPERLAPK